MIKVKRLDNIKRHTWNAALTLAYEVVESGTAGFISVIVTTS